MSEHLRRGHDPSDPAHHARRLDPASSATSYYLLAGRESPPQSPTGGPTPAPDGHRPPPRGVSSPARPHAPARGSYDRDARDAPPLVSAADRREIRREHMSPTTGTTARGGSDRTPGGADGRGESDLGLPAHPRGVGEPGTSYRHDHGA